MPSAPWSVLAIVGFVTSFVVSILGVVLSILGLRETVRTGKRGRGLAIAGIVVGGAFTLFGVVLVLFIVLVVLPVALRESGGNAAGVSQNPAVFGQSDAPPAAGIPIGLHQGMVTLHWSPEQDSPATPFLRLGDDDAAPGYTDPRGACTAVVDMYTSDLGAGSEFEDSASLLHDWIVSPDEKTVMTGRAAIGSAPAFLRGDDGAAPARGAYDVVRSTFTDQDTGDRGEAWARVFDDGSDQIGVVTAVLCADAESLRTIGRRALEESLGAAW